MKYYSETQVRKMLAWACNKLFAKYEYDSLKYIELVDEMEKYPFIELPNEYKDLIDKEKNNVYGIFR